MADDTITLGVVLTGDSGDLRGELTLTRSDLDKLTQGERAAAAGADQLERSTRRVSTALDRKSTITTALTRRVGGLAAAYISLNSAQAIVGTVDNIQRLDVRMQRLVGTGAAFAETQRFLIKTAGELNRNLLSLSESYASILSLQDAGLVDQEQARQLLVGIADAAAALGATDTQVKQALFGLSQGLSSPVLQAQELYQVTEALPTLLNAMDRAAGLSAGGFRRLVLEQKVTSEYFRDTLIKALQQFEGSAAATADKVQGHFSELSNEYTLLVDRLEKPINWAIGGGTGIISEILRTIRTGAFGTDQEQLDLARAQLKALESDPVNSFLDDIGVPPHGMTVLRNRIRELEDRLRRDNEAGIDPFGGVSFERELPANSRGQRPSLPQTKPGVSDYFLKQAKKNADELQKIYEGANEAIAQATLDRIALIDRAEQLQLQRLEELRGKPGVDQGQLERARTEVMRQAAAEREEVLQEIADRGRDLRLAKLDDEHQALVESFKVAGEEAGRQFNEAFGEAQGLRLQFDPAFAIEERLKRLQQLREQFPSIVTPEVLDRAAADAWDRFGKKGEDTFDDLKRAAQGWGRDSARTIAETLAFGETRFRSFGDFAQAIFADILEQAIYTQATGPIADAGGSILSNIFSSVFGAAHGAAFGPGGVEPFRQGGVVDRPTLFTFANGGRLGVMGEAGEEAVMPLARTASGDLGVRAIGGGGDGPIPVTLINQTGVQAKATATRRPGPGGLDELVIVLQRAFIDDMDRNGPMAQSVGRNFAASRPGF